MTQRHTTASICYAYPSLLHISRCFLRLDYRPKIPCFRDILDSMMSCSNGLRVMCGVVETPGKVGRGFSEASTLQCRGAISGDKGQGIRSPGVITLSPVARCLGGMVRLAKPGRSSRRRRGRDPLYGWDRPGHPPSDIHQAFRGRRHKRRRHDPCPLSPAAGKPHIQGLENKRIH
jgi:hypothetical protein